jgi:hypothetical protein
MLRPIKVILLSFFILGLLIFAFSLLIPSSTKVSRATTIAKPMYYVNQQISDLPHWKKWHAGLNNDSTLIADTINYKLTSSLFDMALQQHTDSTLQYVVTTKSKQRIQSNIVLLNHNDSCTVQWQYVFKSNIYPWEKFASLLHDNIYGATLDSNLTALKVYIEKQ